MGDWNITITGTGQHHNQGDPKDADAIANETIKALLDAGQKIKSASFTSGSRLDLPVHIQKPDEG